MESNDLFSIDIINSFIYKEDEDIIKDLKYSFQKFMTNNKKSKIQVKNWLFNNMKYIEYLRSCLLKEFTLLLDEKKMINEIEKEIKFFFGKKLNVQSKITRNVVLEYVINSDSFNNTYYDLIKSLYEDEYGLSINDMDLDFLFDKFKSHCKLITKDHNITQTFDILKNIVESYNLCDNVIRMSKYTKDSMNTIETDDTYNVMDNAIQSDNADNAIIDKSKSDNIDKSKSNSNSKNKSANTVTIENRKWMISEYKKYSTKEPTIDDITKIVTKMNDKKTVFHLIVSNMLNNPLIVLNEMETHFFDVFKRSITIFESIKYYNEYDNTIQYFVNKKKYYDDLCVIAINLYKIYMNKIFDENEFLKTFYVHLGTHINDFEKIIIDELILRDDYRCNIENKIKSFYKESYNIEINDYDLKYIFKVIHDKKLNINDEHILKILHDKKLETDTFIEKINDVYNMILCRKADEDEIIIKLEDFRCTTDINQDEMILMNELYNSLEFNEILKSNICNIFDKIQVKKKPSMIYNILEIVLKNEDQTLRRDLSKLETFIREQINSSLIR